MSHERQAYHKFVTSLLPPTRSVRLTERTMEQETVHLQLTVTAPSASCPCCAESSSSVHKLLPAPPGGPALGPFAVRIRLLVRKFVCRSLTCTRRIFTERVPELVATYARKTHQLVSALQAIGMALGGQTGARLARSLGFPKGGTRCYGWCAVCAYQRSHHSLS
jgi:hypothetical protein